MIKRSLLDMTDVEIEAMPSVPIDVVDEAIADGRAMGWTDDAYNAARRKLRLAAISTMDIIREDRDGDE